MTLRLHQICESKTHVTPADMPRMPEHTQILYTVINLKPHYISQKDDWMINVHIDVISIRARLNIALYLGRYIHT